MELGFHYFIVKVQEGKGAVCAIRSVDNENELLIIDAFGFGVKLGEYIKYIVFPKDNTDKIVVTDGKLRLQDLSEQFGISSGTERSKVGYIATGYTVGTVVEEIEFGAYTNLKQEYLQTFFDPYGRFKKKKDALIALKEGSGHFKESCLKKPTDKSGVGISKDAMRKGFKTRSNVF